MSESEFILIDDEESIHVLTSEQKLNLWGYGEWVEEPDLVSFEYREYECQIQRGCHLLLDVAMGLGQLCGYVNIFPTHPWFKKDYDEIDATVHGGLTYSALDVETNTWVIGFDCAHYNDIIPGAKSIVEEHKAFMEVFNLPYSYKNVGFVKDQLKSLVEQARTAFFDSPRDSTSDIESL